MCRNKSRPVVTSRRFQNIKTSLGSYQLQTVLVEASTCSLLVGKHAPSSSQIRPQQWGLRGRAQHSGSDQTAEAPTASSTWDDTAAQISNRWQSLTASVTLLTTQAATAPTSSQSRHSPHDHGAIVHDLQPSSTSCQTGFRPTGPHKVPGIQSLRFHRSSSRNPPGDVEETGQHECDA